MKKLIITLVSLCLSTASLMAQGNGSQTSFLIGGLLYAGERPINNPENTGDVGFAYLYRAENNIISPVDTVVFDSLGFYYFEQVPAGKYIIKAGLIPGSSHFSHYLPTYFGDNSTWERADTIAVTANNYNCHISMAGVPPYIVGTGRISGFLTFENFNDSPLPPCEVYLSTASGIPTAYTYSGPAGTFVLDDVPYGDYIVTADVTGKTAQKVSVSLYEGKPQAEGIEIRLQSGPQGVYLASASRFEIEVYPNPTAEWLTLKIISVAQKEVVVILSSSSGVPLYQGILECSKGETIESIDFKEYSPGTYLLKVQDPDSKETIIKKVLHR